MDGLLLPDGNVLNECMSTKEYDQLLIEGKSRKDKENLYERKYELGRY